MLSETICLVCFCVLFSKIYTKIKFAAKACYDPRKSCNYVIFLCYYRKLILVFYFAGFELFMFQDNIMNIFM